MAVTTMRTARATVFSITPAQKLRFQPIEKLAHFITSLPSFSSTIYRQKTLKSQQIFDFSKNLKLNMINIEFLPSMVLLKWSILFPSVVLLWSNEKSPPNRRWFFSLGGPEEDRTPEPFGCEPNALPAELRAHITAFCPFFRTKSGFLKF